MLQLDSGDENVLVFAVPKKGRLNKEVMEMLEGAGIDAKRPERTDVVMCNNFPMKLVFLPACDIPMYIMDGNVDAGISGSDMLEEAMVDAGLGFGEQDSKPPLKIAMKLGLGKCDLCVQAPREQCQLGPAAFAGKRIVTSFPALTKKYFSSFSGENSSKTKVKVVSGSVEAACALGLADAIVDLVETGGTMRAAGLDIVSKVFSSEAIIMQQTATEENGLASSKGDNLALLIKRIDGYLTARRHVLLVFNCKEENLVRCSTIAPGKRSPTITELQEKGWYSVSVLVGKSQVHRLMDQLSEAGAQDLVCTGLVNTRM